MAESEKEFARDKRLCYDLEKIDAKLLQEASRLELFKSCFEQTSQFFEDLTHALADTQTKLLYYSEHSELTEEVAKEMANFEDQVVTGTKSFNQDLMEPLDIFLEHYRGSAKEFVQEAARILKEVNEERAKVEKKLKAYNQSTSALDKLQESLLNTEDSNKLEAIKAKMVEAKKVADQKYQVYIQATTDTNSLIKEREDSFISVMEAIEQLEESRLNFSRTLLAKHLHTTANIASLYVQSSATLSSALSKIDSKVEFDREFNKSIKSEKAFDILRYIPSKQYQGLNAGEQLSTEESNSMSELEESKGIIKEFLHNLQHGKIMEQGVTEQLKEDKSRHEFALLLEQTVTGPLTVNEDIYEVILKYCNVLLDEFAACKDNNCTVLESILASSRRIFNKCPHKKEFLYLEIIKHKIWRDIEVWRKLIDHSIDIKLRHVKGIGGKEMHGRQKFGKLFSKMKTAFGFKSAKITPKLMNEEDEAVIWKLVINVLSHFAYYLSSSCIEFSSMIALCKDYEATYGIPGDRMAELELDLKACQALPQLYEKKKDKYYRRFVGRCKKYGKKKPFLLSMTIKFIGEKSTLRNLLLLNRMMYSKLKIPIFRQVLVKLRAKMDIRHRLSIWSQILNTVFSP
eukprot:TRINITY_DN2788_c0_g1_i3.p1 TRINITY_DN2788_c0_g1~~TRINITY_DN2788_c0_g1_i3.p1  ORF type:complete len:628 (-),score=156.05 TRINITY_DN2788_c0_g1_i3:882-2765(-)